MDRICHFLTAPQSDPVYSSDQWQFSKILFRLSARERKYFHRQRNYLNQVNQMKKLQKFCCPILFDK